MPDVWTGEAVGRMHVLQISHREVAAKMGVSNRYLSMLLNGHRTPSNAQNRVNWAIDQIVSERDAEGKAESSAC